MILGQGQRTRLHDPSCACLAKQLASWQIPTQHDSQMNCQGTQTCTANSCNAETPDLHTRQGASKLMSPSRMKEHVSSHHMLSDAAAERLPSPRLDMWESAVPWQEARRRQNGILEGSAFTAKSLSTLRLRRRSADVCRLDRNASGSGYGEMTFACLKTSHASLAVHARRKTAFLRFRQNRGFSVPCLQIVATWSAKGSLCSVHRTFGHRMTMVNDLLRTCHACIRDLPPFIRMGNAHVEREKDRRGKTFVLLRRKRKNALSRC